MGLLITTILKAEASANDSLHMPSSLPEEKLEQLQKILQGSLQKERVESIATEKRIWSSNVNKGDGHVNSKGGNRRRARYTSTSTFLIGYIGREEQWLASLMNLDDSFQDPIYVQRRGVSYLMTGEDCRVQYGHNDFQSAKSTAPGYFVIMTGAERSTLHVCAGPHLYVFYLAKDKKMLANALTLEEFRISPNPVFLVMATCNMPALGGEGHKTTGIISTSSQCKTFLRMQSRLIMEEASESLDSGSDRAMMIIWRWTMVAIEVLTPC